MSGKTHNRTAPLLLFENLLADPDLTWPERMLISGAHPPEAAGADRGHDTPAHAPAAREKATPAISGNGHVHLRGTPSFPRR